MLVRPLGTISSQFAIRMKKNSDTASATANGLTCPRLSSTWSDLVDHALPDDLELGGDEVSGVAGERRRAQKPRTTTIVPATSVVQIVSMLKVIPKNCRWTCSPILMSAKGRLRAHWSFSSFSRGIVVITSAISGRWPARRAVRCRPPEPHGDADGDHRLHQQPDQGGHRQLVAGRLLTGGDDPQQPVLRARWFSRPSATPQAMQPAVHSPSGRAPSTPPPRAPRPRRSSCAGRGPLASTTGGLRAPWRRLLPVTAEPRERAVARS